MQKIINFSSHSFNFLQLVLLYIINIFIVYLWYFEFTLYVMYMQELHYFYVTS